MSAVLVDPSATFLIIYKGTRPLTEWLSPRPPPQEEGVEQDRDASKWQHVVKHDNNNIFQGCLVRGGEIFELNIISSILRISLRRIVGYFLHD